MCFPQMPKIEMPRLPQLPQRNSEATERRVTEATQPDTNVAETVLTSPLGDPGFGKKVSRTILSGILT